MTSASDRAWTAWHQILIPLLRDACVLTDTPPAPPTLTNRRWADTRLRLAGLDAAYPGQIAARRQHAAAPIVRFTLDVCRAIAADIHAHDPHHHLGLPPVVLVDADQPVLVAAADDLDAAWRGNATILLPDPRRVVAARVPPVAVARRPRHHRPAATRGAQAHGRPIDQPAPHIDVDGRGPIRIPLIPTASGRARAARRRLDRAADRRVDDSTHHQPATSRTTT